MINKENLTRMYEGIVSARKNELKTSQLNSYGLHSRDLTKLMEEGILKRVKRCYYQIISVEDLYNHTKYLVSTKNYDGLKYLLEECYKIEPRYKDICLRLFYYHVRNNNYLESMKYFDVLFHTGNESQMKDNNCYLYLLNMIIDLPEEYHDYANKIKFEDMKIDSNDRNYSVINNKIRYKLFNRNFNDLIKQIESKKYIQNPAIKALIIGVMKEQERIGKHITILSKEKKYEDMVDYLKQIQEKCYLNNRNKHYLFLAEKLLEMKKTKQVPKPVDFPTESLFDAIDSKNFELALSIQDAYIQEKIISPENNAFHILLTDINNMIKEIKNEECEKPNSEEMNLEVETKTNDTILDIADYLMNQDYESAFPSINGYLKERKKEKYQFLIEDLIYISVLNEDMDYIEPITTLMYIGLNKFSLDVENYVRKFYFSMEQDKFDEASIYLDMISKSKKLGQGFLLPYELNLLLCNVDDMMGSSKTGITHTSRELVGRYLQTIDKEDILPQTKFIKNKRK